jgi:dolichol-phosphate mannosyltransferase
VVAGYGIVVGMLVATGRSQLEHGWLSLAALIVLSMGLQLTFLGMLGLYIGKIFMEVKGRPLYFVERVLGKQSAGAMGQRRAEAPPSDEVAGPREARSDS